MGRHHGPVVVDVEPESNGTNVVSEDNVLPVPIGLCDGRLVHLKCGHFLQTDVDGPRRDIALDDRSGSDLVAGNRIGSEFYGCDSAVGDGCGLYCLGDRLKDTGVGNGQHIQVAVRILQGQHGASSSLVRLYYNLLVSISVLNYHI